MRELYTVLTLVAVVGCGGSPSLQPSSPPPRHVPPNLTGSLSLVDASFATQIQHRQPLRISKTVSLPSNDDQYLSFWMELSCTRSCEQQLTAAGQVPVFLDWYKEEGGLLLKQDSTTLKVKGTHWRTWGTKRVTVGKWVAVVRAEDSSWICLRGQCHFSIHVQH